MWKHITKSTNIILLLLFTTVSLFGNNNSIGDVSGHPSIKGKQLDRGYLADFGAASPLPWCQYNRVDAVYTFTIIVENEIHIDGVLDGFHEPYFARVITSDATVNTNATVDFEATRSITLRPGFCAQAGSDFCARIIPECENEDNARVLLSGHLGNRNE